jgi:hypothetical protein
MELRITRLGFWHWINLFICSSVVFGNAYLLALLHHAPVKSSEINPTIFMIILTTNVLKIILSCCCITAFPFLNLVTWLLFSSITQSQNSMTFQIFLFFTSPNKYWSLVSVVLLTLPLPLIHLIPLKHSPNVIKHLPCASYFGKCWWCTHGSCPYISLGPSHKDIY